MNRVSEDTFWNIIALLDWDNAGDDDAVMRPAIDALVRMTEDDICAFEDMLAEKLFAIDTREHARHTYEGELDVDNGDEYISADDFLYRRCAVVASGRAFYERVLANPSATPKNLEFESFLYMVHTAFEEKTRREYDHAAPVSFESFQNAAGWAPTEKTRPGRFTSERIPPGNRRPT
jgi:hypothetical protein